MIPKITPIKMAPIRLTSKVPIGKLVNLFILEEIKNLKIVPIAPPSINEIKVVMYLKF